MRTTDIRALILINTKPTKTIKNGLEGRCHVTFVVGIVNPEDKLATVVAGKEPVKQSSPHTTNMQISGWTRGKSRTYLHELSMIEAHENSATRRDTRNARPNG